MTTDLDTSMDDMIRAAYRLSWPGPAPRTPTPMHRLVGRVVGLCRPEPLQGWPVVLSAPAP